LNSSKKVQSSSFIVKQNFKNPLDEDILLSQEEGDGEKLNEGF
jgi:hypothetical protein